MKLVGDSCRHPEPPLRTAFLPLNNLTVLLGPNDSGKSSQYLDFLLILRLLAEPTAYSWNKIMAKPLCSSHIRRLH